MRQKKPGGQCADYGVFDLVVLGCGPAAASATIMAVELGATVMMIGRISSNPFQVGETLPPVTNVLLSQLGVTNLLEQGHLPSHGTCADWAGNQSNENDALFSPYGSGWHVDRSRFDEALRSRAVECGVVTCLETQLQSSKRRASGGWTVLGTKEGEQVSVSAKTLIDATGRRAWFAGRIGVRQKKFDQLLGLLRFYEHVACNDTRTYIESTEMGWFYAVPLPQSKLVVALMTDADIATGNSRNPFLLYDLLLDQTKAIKELVNSTPVGKRLVVADTRRLEAFSGKDWFAAGDAAVSWDPLSSQGITFALQSGRIAAQVALNDNQTEQKQYSDWIEYEWSKYIQSHYMYYEKVTQWPSSKFWTRRQGLEPKWNIH